MSAPTLDAPITAADKRLLADVTEMTEEIRACEKRIAALSKSRRSKIITLRKHRITYREIASAMGVTEQSVYKILRESISEARQITCPTCQTAYDPYRTRECPECQTPAPALP